MKRLFFILPFILLAFLLSSCIDMETKSVLEKDGSGKMDIHYWTKNSNISNDEFKGFGFTEQKVKDNYNSSNSEVTEVKVEKNETDTTTHVRLTLKYKDINKLTDAKAFQNKIKPSWKKGDDGYDFSYVLMKDTTVSGATNKLNYEFEFPGEVLKTNGTKDGNKVKWEHKLGDISKDDVPLNATIKVKGGCGLFGLELPLITLVGVVVAYGLRRKR